MKTIHVNCSFGDWILPLTIVAEQPAHVGQSQQLAEQGKELARALFDSLPHGTLRAMVSVLAPAIESGKFPD